MDRDGTLTMYKLLTSQGASSTLSYMQTFWKNQGDTDEELWEHEWAKVSSTTKSEYSMSAGAYGPSQHGTCMTTMQTKCLPSGSPKGAEAVAFFQTVVALFKNLPTYQWLADAGITPGSSTHTLASMVNALQSNFGATPALDCESGGVYQVSYYYNLKGSVIDGSWIPVNAVRAAIPLRLM
jgi:ribonuclease T2